MEKGGGHGHMILYNYTWTNLKMILYMFFMTFHGFGVISWVKLMPIHNGPWKFIGYNSFGIPSGYLT